MTSKLDLNVGRDVDAAAQASVPKIFVTLAAIGACGIVASIVASIAAAPAHDPMFHFDEDGLNTALSAILLSMASAVSGIVFSVLLQRRHRGAMLWLLVSAGCLLMALDEQLELHERGGAVIGTGNIGGLESFFWNDVIVIVYGLAAVGLAVVFFREIRKIHVVAVLFAVSFALFMAHTAIDSAMPNSIGWKDIPEESAKLLCVFFLLLACGARLVFLFEWSDRDSGRDQPTTGG